MSEIRPTESSKILRIGFLTDGSCALISLRDERYGQLGSWARELKIRTAILRRLVAGCAPPCTPTPVLLRYQTIMAYAESDVRRAVAAAIDPALPVVHGRSLRIEHVLHGTAGFWARHVSPEGTFYDVRRVCESDRLAWRRRRPGGSSSDRDPQSPYPTASMVKLLKRARATFVNAQSPDGIVRIYSESEVIRALDGRRKPSRLARATGDHGGFVRRGGLTYRLLGSPKGTSRADLERRYKERRSMPGTMIAVSPSGRLGLYYETPPFEDELDTYIAQNQPVQTVSV